MQHYMKNFLLLGVLLALCTTAWAQDPQLSQYYSAQLYLNPAFTGNLDYDCRKLPVSRARFISNYRSQYAGAYQTLMLSADFRNKTGNWGYGMLIYQDRQDLSSASSAPLQTFQASALVSYKVNVLGDWKFHSGLQMGYLARSLNWDNFIFPNQLESQGVVRPSTENFSSTSVGGIDASAGVLVYNSDFYLGGAVHHLNQVNMSLTGDIARWPMKVDVHTGYRFPFKRSRGFARRGVDKSVTPVIHYKRQLNTQQLDIGTYVNYEPVVLGAWYRGIPFAKSPDRSLQQDAVVLLAGLRAPTDYGLFKVGLSYDFPVSQGATSFGRTFEISLAYQFIDERCRKRISYKHIPCPGI
jgi:type IX secretion system PorP/SprF family membrane protein